MPDLERELRELGPALAFPPTPDLASPVAQRIHQSPRRRGFMRRHALAVALALVAGAVAGVLLAVPQARTAVLEWLGLRGVTVQRVETLPPAPEMGDLGLGERLPLAEAGARAGFDPVLPRLRDVRLPDEVYAGQTAAGAQVGLVWRDGDGRVELLLTQFRAGLERELVRKLAGAETTIATVSVGGGRGLWLEGAPHQFAYVTPESSVDTETIRLAGNTLLWERGPLTLRLEGAASRGEALRIARSVR